jgi:hypothetical protein
VMNSRGPMQVAVAKTCKGHRPMVASESIVPMHAISRTRPAFLTAGQTLFRHVKRQFLNSHATWIRDSTARNLRCVHQSSMGFLVPLARRTQDPVSRENNSANRR